MSALGWIASFLVVWLGLSFATTGVVLPDRMAGLAATLLVLLAILALYRLRGEGALLRLLRRGLVVLLPIVLAILLPVVWVISDTGLDLRLKQAILAGLIIVAGWLTTYVLQEERRATDRADRRRDTLTALQSETYNIFSKIDNQAIKPNAETVQQKMRTSGMGPGAYIPFSTSESPPIVFNAVSDTISLLSPATIRPVLRFYTEYEDLRSVIEDMRGEEFRALSPERRIAVHRELTRRRIVTLRWGMAAQIAINLALGLPEDKARAFQRSGLNENIQPEGDE